MITYSKYATKSITHAMDANAQAAITAKGITDVLQQESINKFIKDLKAINSSLSGFVDFDTPANSLLKACYVFIGGTADSHKFNLINPVDTDAAFRLVYSGTITHDEKGITPNGTDGFADTKLSPRTELAANSHGLDIFLNSQSYKTDPVVEIGAGATALSKLAMSLIIGTGADITMWDRGVSDGYNDTPLGKEGSTIGLNQLNRTQAGIGYTSIIKNNRVVYTNLSDTAGTLPTETVTLGKSNGLNYFSDRTISYAAIRSVGLSPTVNTLYFNAVIKLQQNLGRCPVKNIICEGHSMMFGSSRTYLKDSMPNIMAAALNASYITRIFDEIVTATSSNVVADMVARYSTIKGYMKSSPVKNYLPIWIGINELNSTPSYNHETVWAALLAYVNQSISDGWTPILFTCLYVSDRWGKPNGLVNAYNTLMKNNHPAGSYVIDGLSHTELQDPYNTTYFDSGLHPTSAGYAILTPDLVALLNTL